MASTHIALLRGVNVGGKHVVRMRELRRLFEQVGCEDVRTYIQSGNVVFRASTAVAKSTPLAVAESIASGLGFQAPVVTRSAKQWRTILASNPFVADCDAAELHVGVLASRPSGVRVDALAPDRSPGDSFCVLRDVIYMHCPNGMARTKLTAAYFDTQLGTICTMRNWRTALKLGELCAT